MSSHTCPACEREFDTSRGLRVHHSATHGTKLPNRECNQCGREFHCEYEKKYCSEECLDEAVSYEGKAHPNWKGGKETTECEICDSEFKYYPSEKKGLYCSDCVKTEHWQHRVELKGPDNPRWDGGKREVECVVCGTTVKRYPSNMTGEVIVCGKECRSEWVSESFVGSGHPNWKGRIKVPYGRGWNKTRRQALERDSYKCMVCSKSKEEIGRNPDVHHIIPLRLFIESDEHEKEDGHYLENVISLCITCHRRADVGIIPKERLYSLINEEPSAIEAQ